MTAKSHVTFSVGLVFSTTIFSVSAFAEDHFRQHDAHVHGQVEFNIAQDGHDLLIEITAPGADVVGFEHQPQTQKQQQHVNQATEQLAQANTLFTLNRGAQCKLEQASVHHTLGEMDAHAKHDDHHDHDSHKDHDSHDSHDSHDDHDHHDHHEHETEAHHDNHNDGHGAFTVEYHYHCDDIAELKRIETQWFTHFTDTKMIHVNLLTDNAQTATELSVGNSVISL